MGSFENVVVKRFPKAKKEEWYQHDHGGWIQQKIFIASGVIIQDNAIVYNKSYILDGAEIRDNAEVNNSTISGNVCICGNAKICNSNIKNNTTISDSKIDNSNIGGDTIIRGNSEIINATINGYVFLKDIKLNRSPLIVTVGKFNMYMKNNEELTIGLSTKKLDDWLLYYKEIFKDLSQKQIQQIRRYIYIFKKDQEINLWQS